MRFLLPLLATAIVADTVVNTPPAAQIAQPQPGPGTELDGATYEELSTYEEIWKRKGGGGGGGRGGGGGGRSGSGSSGGGSSGGGGSRGGSSGGGGSSGNRQPGTGRPGTGTGTVKPGRHRSGATSLGASSPGKGGQFSGGRRRGGRGSSSSSAGGRTTTGSGPRPAYGGGRYYGGGAAVPYRSGGMSPSGLMPVFLAASFLVFWSGLWLAGAHLYHYHNPYSFYNQTSQRNETKPVICGCDPYQECSCDENGDTQYLKDLLGNGSYASLNKSVVTVASVNGTSTILINGTLPNGTTSAGGTESPNAADGVFRGIPQLAGWPAMVAAVFAIVLVG